MAAAAKGKGRPANASTKKGAKKALKGTQEKQNGKKKGRRGPGAYLESATAKIGEIDEDLAQNAANMVGEGRDSDDSEEDEDEDEGAANGSNYHKDEAPAFLLGLNEKRISQTRAELKRIHRTEVAQHTAEKRQAKKANGKGKHRAAEESGEDDDGAVLSDAGSTDMEGASLASDDEYESPVDMALASDEEDAYVKKLQRVQKREKQAEEEELRNKKRKRLPTRDEKGWSSGEEQSDEEEYLEGDDDEDEAVARAEPKTAKQQKSRAVHDPVADDSMDEDEDEANARAEARARKPIKSTVTTAARFGLRSPYEIFSQPKRGDRVRAAREQIARLSTDIINDPEVSLGLIKRLATFAAAKVASPEEEGKSAVVDEAARASAILSLCAVFIDILPGFRIRALTELQMTERVNQELARRREWEQGLVEVYRSYLELCERVSRQETGQQLFSVTLKAMCTLAVKATHFNYRTNLLRSLVSCLSRKAWSQSSDDASQALITVLKHDRHGDVSLEVVRLVNRMIKERHFNVDARVLGMLRYLRLRDELPQGKRATMTTASDAAKDMRNDVYNKKLKSKDIRKGKGEHLSKKEAKRRKEMREIEEELKEAEAEVDQEERERHQTETLKLLFVLYFSVIKAERTSDALLAATLKGLSLFAHRINIDFFRDLLAVVRGHIRRCMEGLESVVAGKEQSDGAEGNAQRPAPTLALQCIVTALELLNGQGEALTVDMSDIVANLYTIMIPLSMQPDVERPAGLGHDDEESSAQLLLRALQLALVTPPVHAVSRERMASFAARMSMCALHTPAKTALALVQTVHILVRRQPALQSLLESGEDRARNGHFDAESEQLEGLRPLQAGCVLWPLVVLRASCHDDVCERVGALLAEA